MRDKILIGEVNREDCDSNEVFEYLELLKQPEYMNTTQYKAITLEEWTRVIKQLKKISTS